MTTYDEVYIFFDTNILESRCGKRLFLSEITLAKEYYSVQELVQDNGLQEKVYLCIPEIVWLEIAEHMLKEYERCSKSLVDKLSEDKKMFGSLINADVEFVLEKEYKSYKEYLREIQYTFLSNPKILARIVPCPKDSGLIDVLIEKATRTISPFSAAKGSKKQYSDAGFKDALIFETFVRNVKDDSLGILFTADGDYASALEFLNKENLLISKSFDEIKERILTNYQIRNVDISAKKLVGNDYLYKQICEELEIPNVSKIIYERMDNIRECEEGLAVKLTLRINGDLYSFDVIYDVNANELFSVELSADQPRKEVI